jgi:hypothetical protein
MKQIMNFVKNTFKDLPKEQGRDEIILSVTETLLEKVEDLVESGMSEQEAIDKTVLEFGSVEDYLERASKQERKEKRRKTINHYRNDLFFSIVASLIIVGILAYINFYWFEGTIWFVIPALALLFWPLSVLYHLLNKHATNKEEENE